jgi:aspartate aminotransferase
MPPTFNVGSVAAKSAYIPLEPLAPQVNLAPGAYKDENGRPWILPSIRKATQKMMDHPEYNHEYTGPGGNRSFALAALDLALGEEVARSGTVASIQTISGTGACHLGATFLAQFYPFPSGGDKKVYIGAPTWANHVPLFDYVGIRARLFDWIDLVTGLLNFDGLVKVLEEAEDSSVVLLQTVAHNPTGVDPTRDQWARLADIFHRKGHFAFFDNAYQGFASGDVAHDRW